MYAPLPWVREGSSIVSPAMAVITVRCHDNPIRTSDTVDRIVTAVEAVEGVPDRELTPGSVRELLDLRALCVELAQYDVPAVMLRHRLRAALGLSEPEKTPEKRLTSSAAAR